jgi:hypothetical protein
MENVDRFCKFFCCWPRRCVRAGSKRDAALLGFHAMYIRGWASGASSA